MALVPRPFALFTASLLLAVTVAVTVTAQPSSLPPPRLVSLFLPLHHAGGTSDQLEAQCRAVSDPARATYGQYSSMAALSRVTWSPHVMPTVKHLRSLGVSASSIHVAPTGDYIRVVLPYATAVTLRADPPPGVQMVLGLDGPLPRRRPAGTVSASAPESMGDAPVAGCSTDPNLVVPLFTSSLSSVFFYIQVTDPSTPPPDSWMVTVSADGGAWSTPAAVDKHYFNPSLGFGWALATLPSGTPATYGRINASLVFPSYPKPGSTVCAFRHAPSVLSPEGVARSPWITPDYLQRFYSISNVLTTLRADTNSQAVVEFFNQWFDADVDLNQYLDRFDRSYSDATVTVSGAGNRSAPISLEGSMDAQVLLGVAPRVNLTYRYQPVPSPVPNQPPYAGAFVLEWAAEVAAEPSPPLVNSLSYAFPEYALTQFFGPSYIPRANVELLKLCVRGVTVLVSAGDGGATDDVSGLGVRCQLAPTFPASSPWVTAVGSTAASAGPGVVPRRGQPDRAGEVVVSLETGSLYTTGGGFSQTNPRPWYQDAAVSDYVANFNQTIPPTANTSARCIPDISALGRNSAMVYHNQTMFIGDGTSLAAPIMAGFVSLANSARLRFKKPPVGFLNPALYAQQQSLMYDVQVGSNYCGFGRCPCGPEVGYQAVPGFDAASGLGTISNVTAWVQAMVDIGG